MGRYIDWANVVGRFPSVNKYGGADQVDSGSILYAEAEVDARLSPAFTTPFSSNNLTAQDLAIDMTYLRVNPLRDEDKLRPIQERVDKLIAALLAGEASMITASGDTIGSSTIGGVSPWSTTMDYPPTFGVGETEDMHVSSSQLYDESVARGDDPV